MIPAQSKDNVIPKLYSILRSNENKRILVVYDSSAFGINYPAFCALLDNYKGSNTVDVLDWESFENYLLQLDMFKDITLDECTPCNYDSREKYAEDTLTQCVGYKKSGLHRCFREDKVCSKCSMNECRYSYSDDLRRREFYVKPPLTSLYNNSVTNKIDSL